MKKLASILFLFLFFLPIDSNAAPSALKSFEEAAQTESGVIDQWANYPTNIRQAMLESSLYPETLARLGREQGRTRRAFQSMVRSVPRSDQEKIYQLVRYPELLNSLVQDGKPSRKQIKNLTASYPKEIQEAAAKVGRKHYSLLQKIEGLYNQSQAEFKRNIQGLPPKGQTAFETLLGVPELLSSMEENLPLTQKMGEAYRSNPSGVERQFAIWEQEAKKRNTDAVAAWEDDLSKDPKARAEMEKAAREYAKNNGYDLSEVDPAQVNSTNVYVNINPYPFWFGYPYWYAYSWWRPYPYWYDLGFYFGVGGGIYFWGYPSYRYTRWYYGYYPNFYRYPYLSSYYWRHYNRYRPYYGYRGGYWRGYRNGFYRGVSNWYDRRGRYYFPNRYTRDGRNPSRFRDYGSLESSYNRYRKKNPGSRVSRQDYFRSRNRSGAVQRSTVSRPRQGAPGRVSTPRTNRGSVGQPGRPPSRVGSQPRATPRTGTPTRYRTTPSSGSRSTPTTYRSGGSSRPSGSTFRSGGSRSRGGGSFRSGGGGSRGGGGGRRR